MEPMPATANMPKSLRLDKVLRWSHGPKGKPTTTIILLKKQKYS